MAKKLDRAGKETAEAKVYTHAQAKADAFADNPEVQRYYDEMKAEYTLKEDLIAARIAAKNSTCNE